jgi:hypothetical protein
VPGGMTERMTGALPYTLVATRRALPEQRPVSWTDIVPT